MVSIFKVCFPRSFLARSNADSYRWRAEFTRTFVERDIPQLGISIGAVALLRFWTMLAHYHGQVWNAAEPAQALTIAGAIQSRRPHRNAARKDILFITMATPGGARP
jgi:predicted AAA+ superfamily ATPase